jgi:hypothetical protein
MSEGTFDHLTPKVWDHWYHVTLQVKELHGGTPMDPRVVEGWIKSKLRPDATTERIIELVRETISELGYTEDDLKDEKKLAEIVIETGKKELDGFKRDDNGLYIEGRQIKAMIKEASNIAYPWPKHKHLGKSIKKTMAERVFVAEDKVYLGVTEPDDVDTRFATTRFGSTIKREEFLRIVRVKFTMATDLTYDRDWWGILFLYAQEQGLGASRSQGFGTFVVEEFVPAELGELA